MLRSLRTRLAMGVVGAAVLFLCIAGLALYGAVRNALYHEFDAVLGSHARILSIMVVEGDGWWKLVYERAHFPEYERGHEPAYFQVWRSNGTVLARSPSLVRDDLPKLDGPVDNPATRTLTLPDGRLGRVAGIRFTPRREDGEKPLANVEHELVLVVARDTSDLDARLMRFRWLLGGIFAGAIFAASLVLSGVVTALMRPLEVLARRIARLDADDLAARFAHDGWPDELRPIAERLDGLLVRLEAAFAREKSFTSDVAHELRTPLSGLRTTIEVTLRQERGGAAYRSALGEAHDHVERLQALVDTLLSLAQLEAGRFATEREPMQLARLVREAAQPYQSRAAAQEATITFALDDAVLAESDPVKVRIIVANLLDNATAYVDRGGSIQVAVAMADGRAVVTVANSGAVIEPEHVERIFDRFWRGDRARTGGMHCGLGLALSRRLAGVLGGTLTASVDAGRFRIALALPIAEVPEDVA